MGNNQTLIKQMRPYSQGTITIELKKDKYLAGELIVG